MVQCPQCSATLPPGSARCQFCGATWSGPPGAAPASISSMPPTSGRRANLAKGGRGWVWTAYYLVAGWWILNGLIAVVRTALPGAGGGMLDGIFGAVTALIGLGLILNVDAVRGIVNVIAFIHIFFGLLSLVMLFLGGASFGLAALFMLFLTFMDIGLSGFMIFLISETETRTPNF